MKFLKKFFYMFAARVFAPTMQNIKEYFLYFAQSVRLLFLQTHQERIQQEFIFPIPKPDKIDPIYFTFLHKYRDSPDDLFKWLFCEISNMQDGWHKMANENPVAFNQMLYQKANEDVEISVFIRSLNGSGFNCMMAELRNLTITGFPVKYLN